jgi:hypothetical protein
MHESMDQESLKLLDESKRIEKVLFSSLHNQSYEHFHEINIGKVFESLPKRVFEAVSVPALAEANKQTSLEFQLKGHD